MVYTTSYIIYNFYCQAFYWHNYNTKYFFVFLCFSFIAYIIEFLCFFVNEKINRRFYLLMTKFIFSEEKMRWLIFRSSVKMRWLIFHYKLVDISSFHIHICIYRVRGTWPSRAPSHSPKSLRKF